MESKIRKKGVPLWSQLQEAIFQVYSHFKLEKDVERMVGDINDPNQRVMNILDIGDRTLRSVLRKVRRNQRFVTPQNKKCWQKTVLNPDGFAKEVIARTIYHHHREVSKMTLNVLLEDLKESGEFNMSRSSLHRLLKEMGFTWKKPNEHLLQLNKPQVVLKRLEFLRLYPDNLALAAPLTLVYLDEAWIFLNGSSIKTWTNDTNLEAIQVTEEDWANSEQHVEKEIEEDIAKENACDNRVEPMIINMDFDESSESEVDNDWEDWPVI